MEKKILIGMIIFIILGALIIAATVALRVNKKENVENATLTSETTNGKASNKENTISDKNEETKENSIYSTGKHHATIVVKNYGTIKLELDADTAPITVANFAKLANEGFYNGLTFHRIMDGFMIQGGDPLGNGNGGSKENIKGEFKANGVNNNISHVRGVISMARATPYNSASSQFFIVHKDSTYLDGQYAGFGKVLEGMEIVDKICKDTKVEDNNGTVAKVNQPVIESITMED